MDDGKNVPFFPRVAPVAIERFDPLSGVMIFDLLLEWEKDGVAVELLNSPRFYRGLLRSSEIGFGNPERVEL